MAKVQGRRPWARRAALLLCVGGMLGGCGGSGSYYPVEWWRQLEGGRIAEARPAPPRTDAPYPHLGSVPTRPAGTDAAARARIASGLVADRSNAQYASQLSPLTAAPPPTGARPPQPAPVAGADDSSASMTAATAPRAAPLPKVQSAALAPLVPAPEPAPPAAPGPGTPPAAATPNTTPAQGRPAAPVAELPDMSASPPPPPSLPGVAGITAPAPPPIRPPAPPPVVDPPAPGAPVAVPFAADRAVLPEGAAAALGVLATRRGNAAILVAGYGEAAASDPDTQAAALPLAIARADAMRAALSRAGVPDKSIRVSVEALGRGGLARIEN